MREIVRSENSFKHQQFGAVEWNTNDVFKHQIILLENSNSLDQMLFNENIELLYKKWMIGEEVTFTIPTQIVQWNVNENFTPTFLGTAQKNEYLALKVQKLIQQQFCQKQTINFEDEIAVLQTKLNTNLIAEDQNEIFETAKKLDENIKLAVAKTRNIPLEQKWIEDAIYNDQYLLLKPKINQIFDQLKNQQSSVFHQNYNTLSPIVEAAYAQAKNDENYRETRKEMIALQKQVIAMPMERWQKNELMDRIGKAFDNLNERQDEWRKTEDAKRATQTDTLQKEFDVTIPQAINSNFNDAFILLKNLQDTTNKSSIQREKRDAFYAALDEAFKIIKEKADGETEANYALASKQIEVALLSSKNTDLFKDARSILIDAQNSLKEIRLNKKQKDVLFTKIRTAFNELNQEQEKYFNEKRKENLGRLEDALQHLERILARKKDGMETLYNTRSNIESKASVIKVDKKSDGTIQNMFAQKLEEVTIKITDSEKDITQLEKKIEKMKKELDEINSN